MEESKTTKLSRRGAEGAEIIVSFGVFLTESHDGLLCVLCASAANVFDFVPNFSSIPMPEFTSGFGHSDVA